MCEFNFYLVSPVFTPQAPPLELFPAFSPLTPWCRPKPESGTKPWPRVRDGVLTTARPGATSCPGPLGQPDLGFGAWACLGSLED